MLSPSKRTSRPELTGITPTVKHLRLSCVSPSLNCSCNRGMGKLKTGQQVLYGGASGQNGNRVAKVLELALYNTTLSGQKRDTF